MYYWINLLFPHCKLILIRDSSSSKLILNGYSNGWRLLRKNHHLLYPKH